MKKILMKQFSVLLGLWLASFSVQAVMVVVTIPPLASAVSPLLNKEDELVTLLPAGQSPHHFHLRPSHMLLLQKADLVISVGGGVDQWAHKAIHNTADEQHIEMAELPGLVILPVRNAHQKEDDKHHDHSHRRGFDAHLWLNAENIQLLVKATAAFLSQNASVLDKKALQQKQQAWLAEIQQTDAMVAKQLQPVQKVPYLVLHDAFQYFEQRYQLNHAGAIKPPSGENASLQKIMQIHQLIEQKQVKCIFKEPQLSKKQLLLLTKDTDVKIGDLNPLGEPGQDYTQLLQALADQFQKCLSDE